MADRSPDYSQAILTHDARFSVDTLNDKGVGATDAAYTQSGPRAGVPKASGSEAMKLIASGSQSEGGEIKVTARGAGLPVPDGATFTFQDVGGGDSSSEQFGVDPITAITGYEALIDSTGSPVNSNMYPATAEMPDGRAFVLVENIESGVGAPFLNMRRYDPASGWTVVTHSHDGATSQLGAGLCVLPSGDLLCFIVADGDDQIDVLRSTDAGTTWNLASERALDIAIGNTDIRKISAAYSNGQVLLIVHYYTSSGTPDLAQYVSYDLGATFRQVENAFSGTHPLNYQPRNPTALALRDGAFLVIYADVSGPGGWSVVRVSRAEDNIATASAVGVGAYAATDTASAALLEIGEGEIYAVVHDSATNYADMTMRRSEDGGGTFASIAAVGGRPLLYSSVGGNAEFKQYAAVRCGGRVLFVGKFEGTGNGSQNESTVALWAGGYSRHTLPANDVTTKFGALDAIAWAEGGDGTAASLWLPFTEPDNLTGWAKTSSGTNAYTDDAASGNLSTTTGTLIYEHDWEDTHAEQFAEFAVQVNSGGLTSADDCSAEVAISDGTSGGAGTYTYIASIRMTTTGWQLYDVNGAATVDSAVVVDLTTKMHFRVAVDDLGNVRVWTTADGYLREWEEGASGSLTNTAAAHGNRLRWGHRASATADSDWYMAATTYSGTGRYTPTSGDGVAVAWTNPDDLRGRSLGATPELVYDGVRLSAAGGPTWKGDSWAIKADYDYPISRLLANSAPSPSEFYRGTADNVEVLLPFDIEPDFTNAQTIGDNFGAFFFNTNVREFAIQTYNGSAWATIATAYAYTDFDALDYVTTGSVAGVDTGSSQTGARYFFKMAHAGDTFDFQDGTPTLRKIEANTPGAWTDSTTVRPELKLEDTDGTEPASGTGRVWRRDFGIVYAAAISTQQMRIRIPAHETADGYYQIGTMIMGPLTVFGKPTDRGWARDLRPNVDVTTRRDGVRRAQVLGAMRESTEIAWTEGFDDLSALQQDDPVPDWVGNNGTPSASHRGTAQDVLGTVRELGGALHPCVYIGRVDKLSGASSQAFTMPGSYMYGRIVSNSLRTETIHGTESLSEAQRLNVVTFEEEL
jgi:hypothetical protein